MNLEDVAGRISELSRKGGRCVIFLGSNLTRQLTGENVEVLVHSDENGWKGLAKILPILSRLHENEELREFVRLLSSCSKASMIHRIVYTGIDGILSRWLGKIVIDVYGSLPRGHCIKCGLKVWLDKIDERKTPRCPRCRSLLKPDYVLISETPQPRRLSEAVYELTTADLVLVYASSLKTLDVLLPLVASKFTSVVLLGENPILSRFLRVVRAELDEILRLLCPL